VYDTGDGAGEDTYGGADLNTEEGRPGPKDGTGTGAAGTVTEASDSEEGAERAAADGAEDAADGGVADDDETTADKIPSGKVRVWAVSKREAAANAVHDTNDDPEDAGEDAHHDDHHDDREADIGSVVVEQIHDADGDTEHGPACNTTEDTEDTADAATAGGTEEFVGIWFPHGGSSRSRAMAS
jgi:hypothetical protein